MHANINGSEAFAEVGEGPEVVGPNTKVQLCIISIAKQLLSRRPRGTAYKQTKTGPKIEPWGLHIQEAQMRTYKC